MSKTLFISDLHLCEGSPATSMFLNFLQNTAINADALYILGDLFEAWIGDDDTTTYHQQITSAIRKLAETGIPIYFMRGNRDFLISQPWAQQAGVKLLEDPTVINLYGKNVLLMHGDSLCTDDMAHQRFRRITQISWLKKLFLLLPIEWRRAIGKKIRAKSKRHQTGQASYILDVTSAAVQQAFQSHSVATLIHGHTHRPEIHALNVNDKHCQRIVLGAWDHLPSEKLVLAVSADSINYLTL